MNRPVVILVLSLFLLAATALLTSANVVLISNNVTLSFDDIEANFAPEIEGSGVSGVLYMAEPLNACSNLTNNMEKSSNGSSPIVLIIRGNCSFEEKVRNAQKAGFKAAIVYDDEDDGILVAMAGNGSGIKIPSVFVSKASGETLKSYAGFPDVEVWISPSFENSVWSIMAISFISLLAMSAVLATCFFVRRHRIRREQPAPRGSRVREFHGMSRRLVKAMPSLIFTAVTEDNCTSSTCAICLEDYIVGEKLRILPCRHKFHAFCVDSWLTSWRTFCPVCKRDARTITGDPPASESTPLLYSTPSSLASSSVLSSFRSSLHSSSAIQIGIETSQSPYVSHLHSLQQSFRSIRQSPSLSLSRSSVDLRNASSQRSHGSHLIISPRSMGYPSISPLNSRYMSPYMPSSSNGSSFLVSSSSRPLHYSESAASVSPFASTHSLPEC